MGEDKVMSMWRRIVTRGQIGVKVGKMQRRKRSWFHGCMEN